MYKFTPGPWEINRELRTAINSGAKHIALVNQYNAVDVKNRVWDEEHDANARLIVAAPEMFEVCALLLGAQDTETIEHATQLAYDVVQRVDALVMKEPNDALE